MAGTVRAQETAALVVPLPPALIPDVPADDVPADAAGVPADPEFIADPTLAMAIDLDGAGGGVSSGELLSALESAAEAGQPIALWRLGIMYETGEGVQKDDVRAFGYFSRIANDYANTSPNSFEADIVAQSFVKVSDYIGTGLPDAGIKADASRAQALISHAATYFGDADAQYRLGRILLSNGQGVNTLMGARWLYYAARKGHVAAQATLGDLKFHGEGIEAQPVEGLMWLTIAHNRSLGTPDEIWINELLTSAMSIATPDQRAAAIQAAETFGAQFGG